MSVTRSERARRGRGGLGRTLLVAFLLLTLVPLIGISVVATWQQYTHSRAQIVDQLTSIATLKETEIKTWFDSLSPDLELLIADPHIRLDVISLTQTTPGPATLREAVLSTLKSARASGGKFEEIFLMDINGVVALSTNPEREGQNFDAQPFYQKGLAAPYAQSPFYSLIYDKMVVFAAAPVRDAGGRTRGVLAGVAGVDTLNAIMRERAGLGETGETYLVNTDYIMLTEPRQIQPGGFPAVHTPGADAALAGQNGVGLYKNYQHPSASVVGVYHWIPDLHVALLAEQSQAEAFATTTQSIWSAVTMAVITALITVVAAVVVTRSIAAPIEHLTLFAARAAEGDLAETAPIERSDEIGVLADAFNAMIVELRELIGDLEARVAARTAELEAQKEALRASEQRLSLHVQQTPLAVIEWDLDFQVTAWNPSAEKIFGYSREEALGRCAAGLIVPTSAREQVNQVWDDLLAQKGGRRSTSENITQDGRLIACEWYNTLLVDQAGKVIGVASLVQDVTERKQAEEQLQRYSAELAQSNEELKRFSYIVSHDLRAPLVNLKGFAGELHTAMKIIQPALTSVLPHLDPTLRADVTTALETDLPEALGFIDASVNRMDHFINALLKLSRLGRRDLDFGRVNMDALVQDTLETLAHQIGQRGVRVIVEPLPEVVVDRTAMEQILANILNNAVIYLDPARPGEIEISGYRNRNETVFHIRDNGRGIASEDLDKVFAPFRRAGKQDVPGEGMGLAYVQTLVRRHEGRIWCDSEVGIGTMFTFTISNHLMKGASNAT